MTSVCVSESLPSSRLATICAENGGAEQPCSYLSAPCNQENWTQPVLTGPVLCLTPDLQTGICPHNTCKDNCAVDTRSGRSGWLSEITVRRSRQVVLPCLNVLGKDVGTGDSELSAPELRASGLITVKWFCNNIRIIKSITFSYRRYRVIFIPPENIFKNYISICYSSFYFRPIGFFIISVFSFLVK